MKAEMVDKLHAVQEMKKVTNSITAQLAQQNR
jgi:hypothetical protein